MEINPYERFLGFACGIASGVTKLVIGHPFDTIKVRMQTEGGFGRFKGPWDCIKSTLKKEGVLAFYKGATPPLFGWMIMDSVQLGTLTNLRLLLQDNQGNLTLADHALAGLGAGITVSFVASPIEVIKAKLQVQYDGKKLYSGPVAVARALIREDGIMGLYRGCSGTLLFRSFFWVLWGSYHMYTEWLRSLGYGPSAVSFIAGGLAANTFWTISFPADVVKNRLMTRPKVNPPYTNLISCAQYVYRTEGVKGFFRGFVPCFLRSFPTNASAIFVFETLHSLGTNFIKNK